MMTLQAALTPYNPTYSYGNSPLRKPKMGDGNSPLVVGAHLGQGGGDTVHFASRYSPTLYWQASKRDLNGLTLNNRLLQAVKSNSEAKVREAVRVANNRDWGAEVPFFQSTYEKLGLQQWVGIPPVVAYSDNGTAKNTHGLLAYVFLEILKDPSLTPCSSAEEAIRKVDLILEEIHKEGEHGTVQFLRKLPPGQRRIQLSHGIHTGNYYLKTMKGKALTMIFTRHVLVITPSGAISILPLPSKAAMKEMLDTDPNLQKTQNFLLKGHPYFRLQVEGFLNGTESFQHPGGYPARWEIEHSLLEELPWDVPFHVKSGAWKPILDIPDTEGKTVWDRLRPAKKGFPFKWPLW